MGKPEVIEEHALSLSELKEKLDKIYKRDEELNFRANKTQEYLNQFSIPDTKAAKEIQEKIEKINIPRMKPEHIVKLIDIRPGNAKDVKMILQPYLSNVSAENCKKIADVLKEYE